MEHELSGDTRGDNDIDANRVFTVTNNYDI